MRGATFLFSSAYDLSQFQSTLPMRGATETFGLLDDDTAFQSTLPMRGATCGGRKMRRRDDISIHAPHAGSDDGQFDFRLAPSDFNPRSPCGERPKGHPLLSLAEYFNPRSPCGERLHDQNPFGFCPDFNPRSPCGERRLMQSSSEAPWTFQSTLPMRGATHGKLLFKRQQIISIHAPHAGSDTNIISLLWILRYFNPRSPCGERPPSRPKDHGKRVISIHAPHAGSDGAPGSPHEKP